MQSPDSSCAMSQAEFDAISIGFVTTPPANDNEAWQKIEEDGFPCGQSSNYEPKSGWFALSCLPNPHGNEDGLSRDHIDELRKIIKEHTRSESSQVGLWVSSIFERSRNDSLAKGEWAKRRLLPFFMYPTICLSCEAEQSLWVKAERVVGKENHPLLFLRAGEISESGPCSKRPLRNLVLNELIGDDFHDSNGAEATKLLNYAVNLAVDTELCDTLKVCKGAKEDRKLTHWDTLRHWTGKEWTGRNKLRDAIEERSTWKRYVHSNGRSCLLGLIETPLGKNYIRVRVDWQWLRIDPPFRYETTSLSEDAVVSQLGLKLVGDVHYRDLSCLTGGVGTSCSLYLEDCEPRIVAIANILATHSMLKHGKTSKEVIELATDKLSEMKERVRCKHLKMTYRIGKAQTWTRAWEDRIEINKNLTLMIIPALVSSTRKGVKLGEAKFANIRDLLYAGTEAQEELPADEVHFTEWRKDKKDPLKMYLDMYVHHATLMNYRGKRYLKLELALQLLGDDDDQDDDHDDDLIPNPLEGSVWYPSPIYATEYATADILARTALVLGAGHLLQRDKIREKQKELVDLCKKVNWRGIIGDQQKKPDCDVEMYMRAVTHPGTESRSIWAFICSIFLDPATHNSGTSQIADSLGTRNTSPSSSLSGRDRNRPVQRLNPKRLRPRSCWNRIRFPFGTIKPPFENIIVAGEKTFLYFVPPIITIGIAVLVALIMGIVLWREKWDTVEKLASALTAVLAFVLTIGGFFHKFVYPGWDIPYALSWRMPIEIAYSYGNEEDKRDIAKAIIRLERANEVFANQNTSFLGERSISGNLILRNPLTIGDLLECTYQSGVSAGKEALCHESLSLIDDSLYGSETIQYRNSVCLVTPRQPINPDKKVI